jgi:CRISPR-associated protein Cas1
MHVVEVSQASATVRISDGCLMVAAEGRTLGRVPLREVGVVLLGSSHAMCSVSVLARLAEIGTPVVFCDGAMRPAGMVLPFRGQHEVGRRIGAQASAPVPKRRRIWKALIQSKIAGQAATLADVTGSDHHLGLLLKKVRSGDPDNVEARAARRYWGRLLGTSFRRRRGEGLANKMLDYGYAVLRAAVTRSICVAGLHPSLGLHHHHRANAFALADDLMEPYRPAVDRIVAGCIDQHGGEEELSPHIKRVLASCLTQTVPLQGQRRTVEDALGRSASSLAEVLLGEQEEVALPWIG